MRSWDAPQYVLLRPPSITNQMGPQVITGCHIEHEYAEKPQSISILILNDIDLNI